MHYIFSLFILLSSFNLLGQAPKFYAETDARKVVEGSYITVSFVLENADGNNFRAPSLKDFNILSGPSKQSSMSIVNGKVSKSLTLGYSIQPKKIGRFKIGAASIQTKNGTLKSQPMTIEVVKGSNKKVDSKEEIFIVAEVSDSMAYVGQQLILDYKLYTTLDVRSIDFLVEPEYDGFFVEQLRTKRQAFKREIINGIEYFTKTVKKLSVFPQQTGTYKIDPVPVSAGISNGKSSRGFFFSSQLIPKRLMANGLTIKVSNTPPTTLPFSGAIGDYKMLVSSPKRSLTTDEAIIITMQITGNGDNKAVMAPSWTPSDSLEIYDPNVLEDEVFVNSQQITHRKAFEYLLVPKVTGRYNLRPRFTYFNPDSNRYITITKKLPSINVLPGSMKTPVIEKSDQAEMAGIYPDTRFKTTGKKIHGSIPHWLLLSSIFLGSLGIYVYGQHLEKSGKRDPLLIKKNKAQAVAMKRLEKANTLKQSNNSKAFHEEIIVALKKYFTDKYQIKALHINKTDLISALRNEEIKDNTIDSISKIIDQSEIAIYAPSSSAQMDSLYNEAVNVISDIEA